MPRTKHIDESMNGEDIKVIQIPDVPEKILVLQIAGDAMLQNRMLDDAKDEIKGIRKGGDKKDYSSKMRKWKETGHYNFKGQLGFPAEAFLKAMGSILKGVELSKKNIIKFPKDLYRAMHIESDAMDQDGNGIVLYSSTGDVKMHEHMAVLKGKTPIPVYRTLVTNWKMDLRVVYNTAVLNERDICLLANRAGSGVGVGAFRAESRGPYGAFRLERAYLMSRRPQRAKVTKVGRAVKAA